MLMQVQPSSHRQASLVLVAVEVEVEFGQRRSLKQLELERPVQLVELLTMLPVAAVPVVVVASWFVSERFSSFSSQWLVWLLVIRSLPSHSCQR